VSMSVAVIALVIAVSVAIAAVVAIMSTAVIAVVFVLAVVMAIVVADLPAIFAAMEISLPSAVTAPVCVLAADREPAMVAEARIVGAINVSAEADRPMEPRSCTEEDSAAEPSRSVIAEGSAVVWRVIVVAVWAGRLRANVDGDLYLGFEDGRGGADEREESRREKPERFHLVSLDRLRKGLTEV
jgi:hypothetical protein